MSSSSTPRLRHSFFHPAAIEVGSSTGNEISQSIKSNLVRFINLFCWSWKSANVIAVEVALNESALVPPNSRSDHWKTSFERKLQVYLAAHRAKDHVNRLGFGNLRILTVTTRPERITSMLAAIDEITASKGSRMFLFLRHDTFQQFADPVAVPWITRRGSNSIVTM